MFTVWKSPLVLTRTPLWTIFLFSEIARYIAEVSSVLSPSRAISRIFQAGCPEAISRYLPVLPRTYTSRNFSSMTAKVGA